MKEGQLKEKIEKKKLAFAELKEEARKVLID